MRPRVMWRYVALCGVMWRIPAIPAATMLGVVLSCLAYKVADVRATQFLVSHSIQTQHHHARNSSAASGYYRTLACITIIVEHGAGYPDKAAAAVDLPALRSNAALSISERKSK